MNLISHTQDSNNAPDKKVQGIGRLRGLDNTTLPFYLEIHGRSSKNLFDVKYLREEADYYPTLFKNQRRYNQTYLEKIADDVTRKTAIWVLAHQPLDTIDDKALERHVFSAIKDSLILINRKNNHDLHLSRQQLRTVLHMINQSIKKVITYWQGNANMHWFIKALGNVLYAVCNTQRFFQHLKTKWRSRWKSLRCGASNAVPETLLGTKAEREKEQQRRLRIHLTAKMGLHDVFEHAAVLKRWFQNLTVVVMAVQIQNQKMPPQNTTSLAYPSLFLTSCLPLFKQPTFRKSILTFLGQLNQQDYQTLLVLKEKNSPLPSILNGSKTNRPDTQVIAKKAQRLFHFTQCLKKKQYDAFSNTFLIGTDKTFLAQFTALMTDLKFIIEQMYWTLQDYNDCNTKGHKKIQNASLLYKNCEEKQAIIKKSNSNFATTLYFVHALKESCPLINKLTAFQNRHRIRTLNRVRRNIIVPLARTVGRGDFFCRLVRQTRDLWFTVRKHTHQVSNVIKRHILWPLSSQQARFTNLREHIPNKSDQRYSDIALDLAHDINKLHAMDLKNLTKKGYQSTIDKIADQYGMQASEKKKKDTELDFIPLRRTKSFFMRPSTKRLLGIVLLPVGLLIAALALLMPTMPQLLPLILLYLPQSLSVIGALLLIVALELSRRYLQYGPNTFHMESLTLSLLALGLVGLSTCLVLGILTVDMSAATLLILAMTIGAALLFLAGVYTLSRYAQHTTLGTVLLTLTSGIVLACGVLSTLGLLPATALLTLPATPYLIGVVGLSLLVWGMYTVYQQRIKKITINIKDVQNNGRDEHSTLTVYNQEFGNMTYAELGQKIATATKKVAVTALTIGQGTRTVSTALEESGQEQVDDIEDNTNVTVSFSL